jgi:hypothetical protein
VRFAPVLLVLAGCGRLNFGGGGGASDGGGTDTTTGDTRMTDAPGDGVLATTCGTAGGMACDGFEGTTIDPMWTVDTSVGSIAIDSTRAYRGATSAHVHINQISSATTNPRALLLGPAGLPITGTLYFRVWIYVASPLSSTTYLNQMINAADVAGNGISMGSRNGVVTNNDYTGGGYAESTTTFPLDRWACLQFQMPSNTQGTSRVFIDGTEVTDIALATPGTQPAPTHVYIALEWDGNPSTMPAADAWVDEVIVDAQPTTCAQ